MKRISLTFAAFLALAIIAMLFALKLNAQTDATTELNEKYRSNYDLPVGALYTGRTPYMGRMVKKAEAAPAPAAKLKSESVKPAADHSLAATPAPTPKPASSFMQNNAATKSGCSEVSTGLVRLVEVVGGEVVLGGEVVVEYRLSAVGCAGHVVVRSSVPMGASYVRSEPAATVTGSDLSWAVGHLEAGEARVLKVTYKAEKEGTLHSCATVSAEPRVCASIFVGKPVLSLGQSGPETALLGADVTYNLVVKNAGSATAKGVVVSDAVPPGWSHSSGKSELNFEVGDLAPGQAKPVAVTFKANQRGKACHTATASSSNAGKVSADACTVILVPGLKVEQNGTKEQILGRNADYEIVVSNTGDTTLQNVVVHAVTPSETQIVAVPGATLSGNRATWTLASLAPGAKVTQSVKLTTKTAGTHCNTVTASAGHLSDSAKACTLWKGIAAVLLEVADDPDPIQVGESTTYTIKVTNQGFAEIHNVKITGTFSSEVTPVSSPQGKVSNKAVTFPIVATIAAKQSVTYTVTVKGSSVGDSRNKIVLIADELKTPVEEEESTTIY